MKNEQEQPMPNMKHGISMAMLVALGLTALAPRNAHAQQDPQFTQYMFNMLPLNPAYAGSADRVSIRALSRHQWVGLEGAPTSQTISGHSPIFLETLCGGASLTRDEHGPVTQYGFMVDAAYRIFMGSDAKLAFGLQGGLNFFQGDFASLHPQEIDDQVFQQNVSTQLDPQFGFGIMYYGERFYLGLSAPKLLKTDFFDTAPAIDTVGSPWQTGQRAHMFLSGGYVFDLGSYTKFKPTFMLKAVEGAPLSFDISANFLFYEKFWLGAMYRHEDAVGAMMQYQFTDGLSAGYAYDYTISSLQAYNSGTHEIMIGFDFGNKMKGIRSPRYF